jgi:hypothetical protein
VIALATLPDGRLAPRSVDKTIRIWDPKCGAEIARFEDDTEVWSLARLPRSGGTFAVGNGVPRALVRALPRYSVRELGCQNLRARPRYFDEVVFALNLATLFSLANADAMGTGKLRGTPASCRMRQGRIGSCR